MLVKRYWKPFLTLYSPYLQLSIYTAVRHNAEGGHTLILREEDFDVHSKFERYGLFKKKYKRK